MAPQTPPPPNLTPTAAPAPAPPRPPPRPNPLFPQLTMLYTNGANKIPLAAAYPHIKSLLHHPPCLHRASPQSWPCHPCESRFTTHYWSAASVLLDYFSDFFWRDTAHMQAVWFHLLDIWQENAAWLPWESVIAREKSGLGSYLGHVVSGTEWPGEAQRREDMWFVERAKAFEKTVRETVDLVQRVGWGNRGKMATASRAEGNMRIGFGGDMNVRRRDQAVGLEVGDSVIYDPRGEAWCPAGDYETGPWVSGVKPWLQFLGVGGPGVAVSCRTYTLHGTSTTLTTDASNTNNANKNNKDGTATYEEKQITTTRHLPQPAIALLATHTTRTQNIARRLDARLPPHINLFPAVEDHSLSFPHIWKQETHSYISPITGCQVSYSLRNGMPPIVRHHGWGDQGLAVEKPDWVLLDECVGLSRRARVYEAVGGPPPPEPESEDDDDDGEDEGDGEESEHEEEEEEDVFDMWTVVESTIPAGSGAKGSGGEKNEGGAVLDLGPLFEQWCTTDEVEEV